MTVKIAARYILAKGLLIQGIGHLFSEYDDEIKEAIADNKDIVVLLSRKFRAKDISGLPTSWKKAATSYIPQVKEDLNYDLQAYIARAAPDIYDSDLDWDDIITRAIQVLIARIKRAEQKQQLAK